MDSLPIAVPPALVPPRRPPVPFLAAVVPVVAGVVLWLVTGSLYSLCFAALGPLMIGASLVDAARVQRKAGRVAATENERAWTAAEDELRRLHDEERARRWHQLPDAVSCLRETPLRGAETASAETVVVVGAGAVPSRIRASGGDGDRERDFQRRCATLERAPIGVPLGRGVAVRGPMPVARAVARGILVQLGLRFGPGRLAFVGEGVEGWGFPDSSPARSRRSTWLLSVVESSDVPPECDATIWVLPLGADVPQGITTVIDVVEPDAAVVRTPSGTTEVRTEGMSLDQARAVLARSAEDVAGDHQLPSAVDLDDVAQKRSESGLAVAIGRGPRADLVIDIVEDGPHAIVTGTTGSGKSELLVTWVTAMASVYGPDRVIFVLADFKGGTAFDPLRVLPQVTAVITDLDESGARRGVSSLRAELRRREALLAAAGARDVSQVRMARLVIVIDEFAALLQEHPDLGAVFTDIAARGRGLGMHLVIGTQRASGVIRDALAANCPLRLSLRVSEPADSRFVLGSDAAAELPGDRDSRGIALMRRPQDADAVAARVALTGAADLRRAAAGWIDAERPESPWLPPLPAVLPLEGLERRGDPAELVLGVADDPERQRQPLEIVHVGRDRGIALLGAPGTGRTSALRTLASQYPEALWVPSDAEGAWDATQALADGGQDLPRLVLVDDIDARVADLPADYAQRLTQLWEQALRRGDGTTFVITAARSAGPVGRLLDALPRRGLLRMPSRVEHLAAGGDAAGYEADRPAGRAVFGAREVQLAWVPESSVRTSSPRAAGRSEWSPRTPVTACVTVGAVDAARSLTAAYPECRVALTSDEAAAHDRHPAAESPRDPRPTVLVGEADVWQRHWALWQRIRQEGEILIRAEQVGDLRQLAGVREVPPYCTPHAGRAWSLRGGSTPQRVVLLGLRAG